MSILSVLRTCILKEFKLRRVRPFHFHSLRASKSMKVTWSNVASNLGAIIMRRLVGIKSTVTIILETQMLNQGMLRALVKNIPSCMRNSDYLQLIKKILLCDEIPLNFFNNSWKNAQICNFLFKIIK